MTNFAHSPKFISFVILIVFILLISLISVEGGRLPKEKLKKNSNKKLRDDVKVEEIQDSNQANANVIDINEEPVTDLTIKPTGPKLPFAMRFEHCMQFAERTALEIARQLLISHELDQNGWEFGLISLILRIVSKDMVAVVQALNL